MNTNNEGSVEKVVAYWEQPGKCPHPERYQRSPGPCAWCGNHFGARWVTMFRPRGLFIPPRKPSIWQHLGEWMRLLMWFGIRTAPHIPPIDWGQFVAWLIDVFASWTGGVVQFRARRQW